MKTFLLIAALCFYAAGTAQVGINTVTPDVDSDLTLGSSDKGLLLNRVSLTATANATPLVAHVAGMVVYNTATAGDVTPGYYYNDGTKWVRVAGDLQNDDVVDKMTFKAEYAGAALEADGSDNLGFLTSDNAGSTNSWMNYYHWSNTQTDGGTNDYDIILRFTLPEDFIAWETNAIEIDYAATSDANFTATVYIESSAAPLASTGPATSTGINDWQVQTINSTGLTHTAGDTGIIVFKLTATDVGTAGNSAIRLGDVALNYTRSRF